MHSSGDVLRALAVLTVLFAPGARAMAETIPPFDLHRSTERADLVVRGRLDAKGNLTVEAALKGKPAPGPLATSNGAAVFADLGRLDKRKGAVEVVVYLRRVAGRWHIDGGKHGVVGFLANGVCLVHDEGQVLREGAQLGRHPTLTREVFLKRARAAVAASDRRRALLLQPASADRLGKLASFLLLLDADSRRYHLAEIARAVQPLSPVEEKALVALLQSAGAAARPVLLELAGATARGQQAFDTVADSLAPRQPRAVRRAAIAALARIDSYRAAERLAGLLEVEEPELRLVLGALTAGEPSRLSPAVVEPLRKLVEVMRARQRRDRWAVVNESYALVAAVGHHAHPRLLPGLLEWARTDHPAAGQAAGELYRLTGLSPRDDAKAWDAWWKKALPVLEARYDLRSAAGRTRWYRAWRTGSSETRRALLRLWAFEPQLDEPALVGETAGKEGEVAKTVLAALWKHGRLSGATKGALVEKFLSVRLEEVPGRPISRARELRIVGTRHFPFPSEAWVNWRAGIVIGDDQQPKLEGSFSSCSLGEGKGPLLLGSLGGGSYPGSPRARALLELREVVYSRGGQVVWKRQWALGPIRLQKAK